jgi:hypothetical protein
MQQNSAAYFDDMHVKQCISMQEDAFWDQNTSSILGKLFPKASFYGSGIGISSLNVEANNFKTERTNWAIRTNTMQIRD